MRLTQNINSVPAEEPSPSPAGLRPHLSLNKWLKKCNISCLVCLLFSPHWAPPIFNTMQFFF